MEIHEKEFERLENINEKYYELIMAVENRCPGENRHQAVLRIIKESRSNINSDIEIDVDTHTSTNRIPTNDEAIKAYKTCWLYEK